MTRVKAVDPAQIRASVRVPAASTSTGRVAALARPGEILASRTVKDLVTGSGISFTERGSHRLDGEDEQWPLFGVAGFAAAGA